MILINFGKPIPAKIRLTSSGKTKRLQGTREERRESYAPSYFPPEIAGRLKSVRSFNQDRLLKKFTATTQGARLDKEAIESQTIIGEIRTKLSWSNKTIFEADFATKKQLIPCYEAAVRFDTDFLDFCAKQPKDEPAYKSHLDFLSECIKSHKSTIDKLRASL